MAPGEELSCLSERRGLPCPQGVLRDRAQERTLMSTAETQQELLMRDREVVRMVVRKIGMGTGGGKLDTDTDDRGRLGGHGPLWDMTRGGRRW